MQNKNKMTSEDFSKLSSSVIGSNLAAEGKYSSLVASGEYSSLAAAGENSIAIGCGRGSRVKGAEGTLIALTHYKYDEGGEYILWRNDKGDEYIPRRIVTGKIGEKGLLPDTWYMLNEKGEFTECND